MDASDHERFQQEIHRRRDDLSTLPPPAEILVIAGNVTRVIEEYNHRATRAIRIFNTELHNMVKMLSETVATVSEANSRSIERLQSIERQVERAAMIEDIQKLKLQLASCLDTIRQEARSRNEETSSLVGGLTSGIRKVIEKRESSGLAQPDETGLPGRSELAEAIRGCILGRTPFYLVIFVMERASAIRARYGAPVLDQMMLHLSQTVTPELGEGDQIHRWSAAALVCLVQRNVTLDALRAEVARVAGKRLDTTFHVGGRTVMVPLTLAWSVIRGAGHDSQSLLEQTAKFISGVEPCE